MVWESVIDRVRNKSQQNHADVVVCGSESSVKAIANNLSSGIQRDTALSVSYSHFDYDDGKVGLYSMCDISLERMNALFSKPPELVVIAFDWKNDDKSHWLQRLVDTISILASLKVHHAVLAITNSNYISELQKTSKWNQSLFEYVQQTLRVQLLKHRFSILYADELDLEFQQKVLGLAFGQKAVEEYIDQQRIFIHSDSYGKIKILNEEFQDDELPVHDALEKFIKLVPGVHFDTTEESPAVPDINFQEQLHQLYARMKKSQDSAVFTRSG